ncbi:MAG: HAD-IC family P-type ATPase [Acidimicrobiales bacterium]
MTVTTWRSSTSTGDRGLTTAEVDDRTARGETNRQPGSTRSLAQIVRANVVTPFNVLLGTLAVVMLVVGSWRDALFGLVIVANSLIGMVQEVRAKRTLDRLEVLSSPSARVVRDGDLREIPTEAVVLDDLLEVRAGDQLVADGVLVTAEEIEVDEALLTGESDPVPKRPGDHLLAGSIVTAGWGRCEVTAVGHSSFAGRIAAESRRFTATSSELMGGINRILAYVAIALVVVGPVLVLSQHRSTRTWEEAVQGSVAGLVGIVPEGLVLLTSIAFLAAALRLARHRVLVRELPAVEGLARVDVLCIDKTGTLTGGQIVFDHLERLGTIEEGDLEAALGALAARPDANATVLALRRAFPSDPGWVLTGSVAFSSARKWSAASFRGHGTWVMGAPDVVRPRCVGTRAAELAAAGHRTLLLAWTAGPIDGDTLPSGLLSAGLLVFDEQLRADAGETMRYFRDQQVAVKVISGDDPRNVGVIAGRAGIGTGHAVDSRALPDDPDELGPIVDRHCVFGRVVPDQKRALVSAMQARGHVVAMTGDGVNDALALKDADIGVAMGSGAPATRSVAQLVLLDDQFSAMPRAVAEGRRVLANIERVAGLFLTKNVTSLLLSVSVALSGWPYPLLPRHGTLVSSLAIGLPGFFIALGPNPRRFEPGFLRRVVAFAVPAGAVTTAAVLASYGLARADGLRPDQSRTAATLVLLMASLWVLAVQARPFRVWKSVVVAAMALLGALAFLLPPARAFFEFGVLPGPVLGRSLAIGLAAAVLVELASRLGGRLVSPACPRSSG